MNNQVATYQVACRRGMDWVLQYVRDDGAIGPAETRLYYYRVPWMCALMGEYKVAYRKLDWINQHMFTPDGAFEGVSPQQIYADRYGSYPLACLLVGALLNQRLDMVYPGVRTLKTWQDNQTGGVFNRRSDHDEVGEQELFPTAQFGMTMLLVGQIDAAIHAGVWLDRLWALQPEPDRRLYHVYSSRHQGLVMDVAAADKPLYITKKDHPWQHHFNGGIAAAFLASLYLSTKDKTWLDLARAYQSFSMTTDACQFESMQTCKSGWGSGLLYLATRESTYRDWTQRIGDWFLSHQHPDGHWENTPYWNPNPTLADHIEITTEFIMHLSHISMYLSVDADQIE